LSRRPSPLPEVFVRTPALAARISRDLKAGLIRKIAPGLYTTDRTEPLDALVRRLLWPIASLLFPNAVITDRTAFEAGPSADGSVFLAADTERDVALPGVVLRARKGRHAHPGDTPFLGLYMASRARAYLENVPATRARKGVARRLSRRELEARLERELAEKGDSALLGIRDDARRLAPALSLTSEFAELDMLIGALMGTREARLQTNAGAARASGKPYDARRLDLFSALHADLLKLAPANRADPQRGEEARYLPFFEAYFSNFIEGTEFELDEAAAIVFEGRIPAERPEDAHDILGTYRLLSDLQEMSHSVVQEVADLAAFIQLLQRRQHPPRTRRATDLLRCHGRPHRAPGNWLKRFEPSSRVGTLASDAGT